MSEPVTESQFYVCETFTLKGGSRLTEFMAGLFEYPDQARHARDRIRESEPARCVHCVECVTYGDGGGDAAA